MAGTQRYRRPSDSLRPPERDRLRAAVRELRRKGVVVQTTGCCWGCSWTELHVKGVGGDRTVMVYTTQVFDNAFGERGERDGRQRHPLYIGHQGDTKLICEALNEAGLRTEWDGDTAHTIKVLPDARNDGDLS